MLKTIAFFSGLILMALEMTGSRIVAPFLGSSILVWTALIGVILACLSLGYWIGGRAADKDPNPKKLALILIAAALAVLLVAMFNKTVLGYISRIDMQTETLAVLATSVLFGPASFLLGMASPFIVRVALQLYNVPIEKAGTVIGRFSAISAIGSIAGTFLGGFVFITYFGVQLTTYLLSSLLVALSLLSLLAAGYTPIKNKTMFIIPLFALLLNIAFGSNEAANASIVEVNGYIQVEKDTRYSRLLIVDHLSNKDEKLRSLGTPPKLTQSTMLYDKPNALVADYTKDFALAWQLNPSAKRFAMLGGAGFSIPKYLLDTRDNIELDVVEIDPEMTEVAREFFALKDDPRMKIYHQDARVFLNKVAEQRLKDNTAPGYDIIMGDTFSSVYNIPFHLSTKEAFQAAKDSLNAGGVYAINIISAGSGEKSLLYQSIRKTLEEVFPEVRVYPVSSTMDLDLIQNIILVATLTKDSIPRASDMAKTGINPHIKADKEREKREELDTALKMLQNEWNVVIVNNEVLPLTDDLAPVENYARALAESL